MCSTSARWKRNQVVFHDVSFIEVKPHVKKNKRGGGADGFSVFYSQDSIAAAEASLKDKASRSWWTKVRS